MERKFSGMANFDEDVYNKLIDELDKVANYINIVDFDKVQEYKEEARIEREEERKEFIRHGKSFATYGVKADDR